MITLLLFVVGLLLLVFGADFLIKGAANLASRIGVSPLVIGLTVVAFGTSSPELAVSVKAALDGQAGIGLGNVIGSNIFNVLFILGIAAIILPLTVSVQLIRLDVPVMIVASGAVWWMAQDGKFGFVEGLALFLGLLAYTSYLFIKGRAEPKPETSVEVISPAPNRALWLDIAAIVGGLIMLVLGSTWLVEGAVTLARWLGLSEVVIGLTIVAVGTSLPEVVTSIAAAIKGQRDIAVGNVIGSNIFNLLGVLGISSMVAPEGLLAPLSLMHLDLPVMCLVALMCLPIFFTDAVIDRSEGVLFLAGYVAYTAYLIMAAIGHPWLSLLGNAVFVFLLPVGLLIVAQVIKQLQNGNAAELG